MAISGIRQHAVRYTEAFQGVLEGAAWSLMHSLLGFVGDFGHELPRLTPIGYERSSVKRRGQTRLIAGKPVSKRVGPSSGETFARMQRAMAAHQVGDLSE